MDDRGTLAHDFIEHIGEITRSCLDLTSDEIDQGHRDTNVFHGGSFPIEEPNCIWVFHPERNELDIGLGEVLLLESIHCTLAIFLYIR